MPSFAEPEIDPYHEVAYRRGYVQGMIATLSAVAGKLSDDERHMVETWFDTVLMPWERSLDLSIEPPPDFPRIGPKTRRAARRADAHPE